MNTCGNNGPPILSRREMLRRSGLGLGSLALAWLLEHEQRLRAAESRPVLPLPVPGPAKNIILLHMGGGVSQVDSFDPKPALQKYAGQNVPDSIATRVPKGNMRLRTSNLLPSHWEFREYGQSGIPVSALFPNMAQCVDDLCVIRSMRHDSPIHTPADYLTLTGSLTGQRPSLGAWFAYGLGSENQNLPSFITMVTGENFSGPALWASGFLPPEFQGTEVKGAKGIANIALPSGTTPENRRAQLDLMATLNRRHLERLGAHDELEARIRSYEMAFRMQTAAPEVFDLKGESPATRQFYGLDQKDSAEFGANCLLARRLVERGVRFVQLIGAGWDAHSDIRDNHTKQARIVDRPIAALLTDLKARGLLESTLVVWGGEFGRTPTVEGDVTKPGRDHNPAGYTLWLAGGGVKGGQIIGATDDVGYTVVDRPVHPNDLHATFLHAFGLDQRALWYEHSGRKEIVTDLGGEVVKEVFG
jgi:hypothetical protein